MTTTLSVQEYIARQPKYEWRRRILRGLIRSIGFGVLAKAEIVGLENVPRSGPTILMMSHISLIDPVVCIGAVTDRFVIPMTKIENAEDPLFGLLVKAYGAYTVRRGEVDRSALLNSIELLKSGQCILIAPEGTRNPTGLVKPKDGLSYVATKSDAVIVPTAMSEAADFKDRWKHLKRANVRVTFGKPFRLKQLESRRIPRDVLAQMTEESMYQLAITQPDPTLRGVYSKIENATSDYLDFL
ncbi:MAG: lysophospholipid acyltransferase family protein [Aggregatilineales bacterium]